MRDFAAIYGEWSEYYCDYKWQRLTTAARYYGYDFTTHDCLDDALAALYVYKKMSVSANDVIIKI